MVGRLVLHRRLVDRFHRFSASDGLTLTQISPSRDGFQHIRASSTLSLTKKKKPLPPPSRRTLELNKASHGVSGFSWGRRRKGFDSIHQFSGKANIHSHNTTSIIHSVANKRAQRRKHEVLVFVFPLIFALVPVIILVFSPDAGRKLEFDA